MRELGILKGLGHKASKQGSSSRKRGAAKSPYPSFLPPMPRELEEMSPREGSAITEELQREWTRSQALKLLQSLARSPEERAWLEKGQLMFSGSSDCGGLTPRPSAQALGGGGFSPAMPRFCRKMRGRKPARGRTTNFIRQSQEELSYSLNSRDGCSPSGRASMEGTPQIGDSAWDNVVPAGHSEEFASISDELAAAAASHTRRDKDRSKSKFPSPGMASSIRGPPGQKNSNMVLRREGNRFFKLEAVGDGIQGEVWTLKRRKRKPSELENHEKWNCPNGCGKFYRKTSTVSIHKHKRTCGVVAGGKAAAGNKGKADAPAKKRTYNRRPKPNPGSILAISKAARAAHTAEMNRAAALASAARRPGKRARKNPTPPPAPMLGGTGSGSVNSDRVG